MEEKKSVSGFKGVSFDSGDIVSLLLSKSWLIIVASIMCGLIMFVVSEYVMTPVYESSTKIYILNRTEGTGLTYSDMSVSTSLAQDSADLVKCRTVTENVIAQLGLPMGSQELLSKLSVTSGSGDTRILKITVSDEDPYMAREIADTVRDVATVHIADVMDTDSIKVVETANIPTEPASPNTKLNVLIGVVLGLLVSTVIIFGVRIMNDTVTTPEDIEKYLEISVLGSIPVMGKEKKTKKKSKKKRRNK